MSNGFGRHDGPRCTYTADRSPEVKRATALLMRVVPDTRDRHRDPVRYWDAVTSGNDARAALSIALGKSVERINPVGGQG